MSASLVGSEMCIRDRPSLASPGLAFRWPDLPHMTSLVRRRRQSGRHWGCLLYTSDAADDM
eukprot:11043817-Alexandrium_andersonii.AAC.1